MDRQRDMDRISGVQVTALVSSAVIGVGIMSLPNRIADQVKTGATVIAIVSAVMVLIATYIVAFLSRRFPYRTVFDYGPTIVGRILGKLITGVLLFDFILVSSIVVRMFASVIKLFLLEQTPIEVIIISILMVSAYLVQNGINPIARICELFFPITIIALSLLLILSLQNFDFKELYSSWQIGAMDLLKGIPSTMLAYLGFEVLLIVPAFMIEPKGVIKYGITGVGAAVVLYIVTVVMCIGVFSGDDLRYLLYPTLELAKTISFPGAFAERFDIFFAVFWVLAVFTTIAIYHYLSAFSMTRFFGLKNYRPFCYFLLPVIYFLSLSPQNIYQTRLAAALVSYVGGLVSFVLPVVLLVTALLRKKGVSYREK